MLSHAAAEEAAETVADCYPSLGDFQVDSHCHHIEVTGSGYSHCFQRGHQLHLAAGSQSPHHGMQMICFDYRCCLGWGAIAAVASCRDWKVYCWVRAGGVVDLAASIVAFDYSVDAAAAAEERCVVPAVVGRNETGHQAEHPVTPKTIIQLTTLVNDCSIFE